MNIFYKSAFFFVGLLGSVASLAGEATQRNADDSVRITSEVTVAGNFSALDLGEWLKNATDSDFVEVSSLSKMWENHIPLPTDYVFYNLKFVIRKNDHYFTAKCSYVSDLPVEHSVDIQTDKCRWWDEKGNLVAHTDSLNGAISSTLFYYRGAAQ